jgi:hypothetical protein
MMEVTSMDMPIELEQKLEESKSTYEDDFKKEHPEFYDSNGCPIGF